MCGAGVLFADVPKDQLTTFKPVNTVIEIIETDAKAAAPAKPQGEVTAAVEQAAQQEDRPDSSSQASKPKIEAAAPTEPRVEIQPLIDPNAAGAGKANAGSDATEAAAAEAEPEGQSYGADATEDEPSDNRKEFLGQSYHQACA